MEARGDGHGALVSAAVDLPVSWRAALRFCPHCSGGAEADCNYCDGTGDLFGTLLLDAYDRGRQHVIDGLTEVDKVRKLAVERLARERPTSTDLKRQMGLGS